MPRFRRRRGLLKSNSSYDSSAQAYFTAAGITNVIEKNAWNSFVIGTKADGTWSKIVKVWPISPTSSNAAKYCAKTLVQLTTGGTPPTHSAQGWSYNGSNNYMYMTEVWSSLTGLGLTNTDVFSMGLYTNQIDGLPLDDRFFMGLTENLDAGSPPHTDFGQIAFGFNSSGYLGYPKNALSSGRLGPVGGTSSGLISLSSNVDGDNWLYYNGSGVESNNLVLGDNANFYLFFGAANGIFFDPENMEDLGSFYRPFAFQMCFSFIANGFTEAQTASFYTRIQTLETALGRNV